jgi:hypothetical protein
MNYDMCQPCRACPFLIGSGFTWKSLTEHASGEFACHMTCELNEQDVYVPSNEKTPHCAGALIFLEKQNKPHQMMRICERIGIYDRTKLNMQVNVGSNPSDYRMLKQLKVQLRKEVRDAETTSRAASEDTATGH